jgi:biopolymer transport protein TolR
MAMAMGRRGGGPSAEINMTPMIDVLLVLLIIFMVLQPALQAGVSVQAPPPGPGDPDGSTQLVLSIRPGPEYTLNAQPLDAARLTAQLRTVFADRPRRVLFIDAAPDLVYKDVIAAVDASRLAGVDVVGLTLPKR